MNFLHVSLYLTKNEELLSSMGWYEKIYNRTKATYSTQEYKYGTCRLSELLIMEPGWDASDTIVGGGHNGGYHFISGGQGKLIKNIYDDVLPIVLDYEITDDPYAMGA